MKKLVLVERDQCSGKVSELDHCCMPLVRSMFIEVECDDAGKVLSTADNQKLIDEAFKRQIMKMVHGKTECC